MLPAAKTTKGGGTNEEFEMYALNETRIVLPVSSV